MKKRARRSVTMSDARLVALVITMVLTVTLFDRLVFAEEELRVEVDALATQPIRPDTPFSFRLNRQLAAGEGRLAIVVAKTDVTSLFVADGVRFTYVPNLLPLPIGKPSLAIYHVDAAGEWRELIHLELQVSREGPATASDRSQSTDATIIPTALTPQSTKNAVELAAVKSADSTPAEPSINKNSDTSSATEKSEQKIKFKPSLTLGVSSQMAQFNFPANTRPAERATFTDETLQFSLRSESSGGPVSSQTQIDFAGSSNQGAALRFGTLGKKAPQIDLASYLVQLQLGPAKLAIGHTSFGTARHLVNSFSSRGISFTVPVTKRFDFSVAAMNGTNIVGYGNFFGLSKDKHQLQSATLGVELLPERPGGLRLEVSGINAYVQALNSFSQGSVNDVERSKGGSVRLLFTDKSGRLKFDGGFTRSQYRNPADPLLYQGTNTIAVPFLTRNARYIDVSYDVLQNYSLTKNRKVSLNIAARHERVDPLFKSLGASSQADKAQNEFQITGNVGEINFQAGNTLFNDNLRNIPSILRSLTRTQRYSIALPASALFSTTNESPWLPRLSYSFDRTHQFGEDAPVNGGFGTDPSLIPDQFSTSQIFSSEWQFKKVSVGYAYNRSFTDNQQLGRALSDFRNQTHTGRVGFNPITALSLTFDLTREAADDLESATLNGTWRIASTATWNMSKHIAWTANVANTIAGDRARTNDSRNTEFDTQFSYRIGIERGELKKVQAQFFIRFADRYARQQDFLNSFTNLTRVKTINGGLNITFF